MNKVNSPYSAAITGGGFLLNETNILLPLLLSPDRIALLKNEALNNELLQINAETSRKRAIAEVSRRYDIMPADFWKDYQEMSETQQQVALFFVILKTYKICFDFQINVTMKRWNSISKTLTTDDVMMELDEIASRDEFVDSWSDSTKAKVCSAYVTILRRVGMLDNKSELHALECDNYDYYIRLGEPWFLEACLLSSSQIENIKRSLL